MDTVIIVGSDTVIIIGSEIVKVESGGLVCSKRDRELPPKELFCLNCFGVTPAPRVKAVTPKPDAVGGLFDGVPPIRV